MDEGIEALNENNPWDIDELLDDDVVYRQVPVQGAVKFDRVKRFPGENTFILRQDEDSLSFNSGRHIDVRRNFHLIGISYFKDKWLEYTAFKIFTFPVSFLRSLSKFNKISHTPVCHGLPSSIGYPNNKSHISLYCDAFDDGVRVELSEYCFINNEDCYCNFDIKLVKEEIEELRARANDTPYHNLWDFND